MVDEIIQVLPPTLTQFAVGGGAAGGVFAIVRWFFEFFSKRMDLREARIDADTRFLIDNLRTEFSRVTTRLGIAEDQISSLREKLMLCEEKHSHSEARVTHLTALLESYAEFRKDDLK